jgi:uncharacterized protein (DUF983 family)
MPIDYRTSRATAILRGLRRRCPSCGEGHAFAGYLRTADRCDRCGTQLGQIRADDFPPYLTIFLVGHIVVPLLLIVEQNYNWPIERHMLVWPSLTLLLCMVVLPVLKGGVLGLMWSLRITGREVQGRP